MMVGEVDKGSKRIFYLDALRCLAILTVITVHVFMPAQSLILSQYGHIPTWNWIITDFFLSFRCGVDLFLMLAGALSLGRVWTIKSFLSKRIPRIVLPFIFWGLLLSFLFIVLSFYFPHQIPIVKSFDFYSIFNYIVNAFLAKSAGFRPYWFFWMILGTYFIMPIFNKWLLNSKLDEAEYFLVFWLITCIFDYTLFMEFPIKLSYFTSPIGFVVLGYYLRHTQRKIFKNIYVPIILMLLGAVCLLAGSYLFSTKHGIFWFDRYSIFTALEVSGMFLFARYLDESDRDLGYFSNPNGIFKKAIVSIAKYSYGIYLIHNFVLSVIFNSIMSTYSHINYKLFVICVFSGALFGSWAIMALLNKVPYVNQVIGAK